ncbi:MAG: hypothetical protein JEZ09_02110 [Salinivirgaceae bacterium]|nr:hypothetical protein [Salinivirgaceae bacterium]
MLADIFYKEGYVESWGRATLKIVGECKKANILEPNFYEEHGVVKVIFKLAVEDGTIQNDGLNDRQRKVLNFIKANPGCQIKTISAQLGMPIDTLDIYKTVYNSEIDRTQR